MLVAIVVEGKTNKSSAMAWTTAFIRPIEVAGKAAELLKKGDWIE